MHTLLLGSTIIREDGELLDGRSTQPTGLFMAGTVSYGLWKVHHRKSIALVTGHSEKCQLS